MRLCAAKGKIFLHQVAESNHNDNIDYLGNGGEKSPNVHHYFQVEIVEQQTANGAQEIPEQLKPFLEKTASENDIPCKVKANRKGDAKGKQHGGYVGAYGYKGSVYNFFSESKIIGHKKNHNTQGCIAAPTGCIPECLERHPTPGKRVKKIQYSCNERRNHV